MDLKLNGQPPCAFPHQRVWFSDLPLGRVPVQALHAALLAAQDPAGRYGWRRAAGCSASCWSTGTTGIGAAQGAYTYSAWIPYRRGSAVNHVR